MKKFNPKKELDKIQKNKGIIIQNKTLSNLFIPILVIACSCLAMSAVAFSYRLASDDIKVYNVNIDIINGDIDEYNYNIKEGPFMDKITSKNGFGSLKCTSGNLYYDSNTSTISSPYLNEDTNCVLVFMDESLNNLDIASLEMVNDMDGTSYYYKADADNNYVKVKNILFRIVRINGDGTIRLMLDNTFGFTGFGKVANFMESDVKKDLEKWFLANLATEGYIVQQKFDLGNYYGIDADALYYKDGYYLGRVGLLSAKEVKLITDGVSRTDSFNTPNGFYLMNGCGDEEAFAYRNNEIAIVGIDTKLSIRPVINIKATLEGEGTYSSPYVVKKR